jgi:SAM-dependent methyltransferase
MLYAARAMEKLRTTRGADADWTRLHGNDEAWRKKLIGDINELFVIPRYVEFFHSKFGSGTGTSFLELGSGTGDISRAVLASNQGQIGRYVVSEHYPEGVAALRSKGFEALLLDACRAEVADQSFDVVISWDVMHHVPRPRDMAKEMLRIARGRLILVESNGLSVFRKLKELTPAYRAAGETSHRPGTWRSFFDGHPGFRTTTFEIFPFLFPFKVPRPLLPALAHFNRWVERAPFFRWQCSSVAIYMEYQRTA